MNNWQNIFVLLYCLYAFVFLLFGLKSIRKDSSKTFTGTPYLFPLGVFVLGDILVIGAFWVLVSIISLILKDWILFLLIHSLFWVVRSLGETIYWFLQQFSTIVRNPPERFFTNRLVKSDAVWWLHQIFWQCITVASLIFSIYFAKIWKI